MSTESMKMGWRCMLNSVSRHEASPTHERYLCSPTPDPGGRGYTIGYGHWQPREDLLPMLRNQSEAWQLLRADLNLTWMKMTKRSVIAEALEALLEGSEQNVCQLVVLTEMAYQMGVSGLEGFVEALAYTTRHRFGLAGQEMLRSEWAVQTPSRAYELSARYRLSEYFPRDRICRIGQDYSPPQDWGIVPKPQAAVAQVTNSKEAI